MKPKTAKKQKTSQTITKILLIAVFSLAVILIFAGGDFLSHKLSPDYAVPSRYFPNKIIYGTIFFAISLILFRKFSPLNKSLIATSITVILLQIRYFIEGYPLSFVITFLFIHFIILFAVSFTALKFFNKKLVFYF